MTALVALGLRLARAGGRLRIGSIVLGNLVGTVLLLGALVVPVAAYPAGAEVDPMQRVEMISVFVFSLVPAAVLLLTVGRLSSGVRDRRLASLRMLGLGAGRTAVVAAVENCALAVVGAVGGLVVFLIAAPLVDQAVAAGPGWFAQPLALPGGTLLLTTGGVVALSVAISTAFLSTVRRPPMEQRSEAARRRPSPWRLGVLVVGVAALVIGWGYDPVRWSPDTAVVVLLGGGILAAVGIAVVTPLAAWWLSGLLLRPGRPAGLLAGRAIQAEPAGAARMVAGIGVTVYLVLGASGVVAAFESSPQYRFAAQTVHDGPQVVRIHGGSWETPAALTPEALAGVAEIPGVRAVIPDHALTTAGCTPSAGCSTVFVGTCADLAQVMVATGCTDDRAAAIGLTNLTPLSYESFGEALDPGERVALARRPGGGLDGADGSGTSPEPLPTVQLGSEPIMQDVAATEEIWVYQASYDVFVPVALVADSLGQTGTAEVIADGGLDVQAAIAELGESEAFVTWPYPLSDYEDVARIRTIMWSLSAVAIGVGLLSLALTSVDRALERRRAMARQVAVGVPARTLRAGQLLQTLVPLGVGVALAFGCGLVLLRTYAALGEVSATISGPVLVSVVGGTVAGAVLASLATVPTIRTRITADLLRRE